MPQESIFARAKRATVWFQRNNGLGVLVSGLDDGLAFNKWIITGADCIHYDSEGGMVLGDYYLEKVRIKDAEFTVRPLAVEPVFDLAKDALDATRVSADDEVVRYGDHIEGLLEAWVGCGDAGGASPVAEHDAGRRICRHGPRTSTRT